MIPLGFFPKVDIPDWRYGLGIFAAAMLFIWHPFSGGARVPTLILFLLGIAFWATSARRLVSDFIQLRWMFVILCLAVPAIFSLPTSFSPEHTWIRLVMIFAMFVVGSALIEVFRLPNVLHLLQRVLAIMLVVWLVDALVQMVFGVDLLGVPLEGTGDGARVVGLYGNHLYLPWVLVLTLPLLLWGIISDHPYKASLALLVAGVVIIGSGVRSAFLAWLIVAAIFFIQVKIRRKWLNIGMLAAAMAVAIAISPIAQKKVAATSVDQLTFEQLNSFLSGRMYLWETGWLMLQDNPITGVGADAFRSAYGDFAFREDDPFRPGTPLGPQNAHQLYLSIAAETGTVGLLGIVILLLMLARWYFSMPEAARAKARPYVVGLMAVTFPVNSQPLLYKTWWAPLLVFFVAAVLAAVGSHRGDQAIGD